jgi:flavin-binding protein dodecin
MLSTKCQFIWESGFSGKDFLEITQSETRIACGGQVCYQIRMKLAFFLENRT